MKDKLNKAAKNIPSGKNEKFSIVNYQLSTIKETT